MHSTALNKMKQPLLLLAFLSLFAFIGTAAYFTIGERQASAVFVTGGMQVAISQETALDFSGVLPGSDHVIEFQVTNTGNIPAYLKWYFDGDWNEGSLDPAVFTITKVEHLTDQIWYEILQEPIGLGQEFFFSQSGLEESLLSFEVGQQETFRVTVHLSDDLGDEYQSQMFESSLHVAARQIHSSSTWPEQY